MSRKIPDSSAELVRLLQQRLFPVERAESLVDEVEGMQPQARRAAVLLACFERDGEVWLTFIKRATSLRAHSGEIAFPGGRIDEQDESVVAAALREAQEEIGLDPQRTEVLGLLAPVFTVVSNYLISPVVAFLPRGLGELRLQVSEVTELLLIPLKEVARPEIAHTEEWERGGMRRTVYFYDYGRYRIWGATGRILNAFLHLLDDGGNR